MFLPQPNVVTTGSAVSAPPAPVSSEADRWLLSWVNPHCRLAMSSLGSFVGTVTRALDRFGRGRLMLLPKGWWIAHCPCARVCFAKAGSRCREFMESSGGAETYRSWQSM
jgi:hypothetical protein